MLALTLSLFSGQPNVRKPLCCLMFPLPSLPFCSCTGIGCIVEIHFALTQTWNSSLCMCFAWFLHWWADVSAARLCSGPLARVLCVFPCLWVVFARRSQVCGRAVRAWAVSWHAAGKQPGGTTRDRNSGLRHGVHPLCRVDAATVTDWVCAGGFAPGMCCSKILWKCLFLLFVCIWVIKSWCCFTYKTNKPVLVCLVLHVCDGCC